MKKIAITYLLVLLVGSMASFSLAQTAAQDNKANPAQQKKGPSVPIADAMDGFYTNRIQAGVDLTDDQFGKIAPFLLRMLKEKREITLRRNRVLTQLRQATNKGPLQPKRDVTDEELARLTRDLDQTEADRLASQQSFLKNVDPFLNDRQRARLRVFQDNIERQILNILNSIPKPAAPPPPAATPAPPRS